MPAACSKPWNIVLFVFFLLFSVLCSGFPLPLVYGTDAENCDDCNCSGFLIACLPGLLGWGQNS